MKEKAGTFWCRQTTLYNEKNRKSRIENQKHKMKNPIDRLDRRIQVKEEKHSEFEDRSTEISLIIEENDIASRTCRTT